VREEARMGRDKGTLIPAMIDASPAPFGFGEVQGANLASWHGQTDHPDWRRFSEAVRAAVGREAPAQPVHRPQPAASPSWQSPSASSSENKKPPVWVWIAGGAVALLGVLYVIGSMNPSQPDVPMNPTPAVMAPVQQTGAPVQQAPANEAQNIILAQLQQAQTAFVQEGYQQLGQPFSGGLQQGQTWNVPVEMHAGYEYRVVGVCDQDCNDLDLILFDPNGATVAEDTSTDDHPLLTLQPAMTGNYTVEVRMYHCAIAPCYYALALYGRVPG
jgi:hypothetical protein